MLKIGDTAPDFTLPDSFGSKVHLADFQGKKNVVLYFYPKDDTPGCTLEAQGFSDQQAAYEALETVVIGVSRDTVSSHKKFCQKYGLRLMLLADKNREVIENYGAWQYKKMFGREFKGTIRITFLIDKNGIIRQIWPNVTVEGHEKEVLGAIQRL